MYIKVMAAVLLLLCMCFPCVVCNLYDPHEFPDTGPFVEGWYARIIDDLSSNSFGLLFGKVLPRNSSKDKPDESKYPPIMLNFIHSRGDNDSMESFAVFPALHDIEITVKGKPVSHDPDFKSPSDFEWNIKPYGYFKVVQNRTIFNFSSVEGVHFSGEFGPPEPWGPNGEGPEGWIDHVPFLPLHWFIYSLGSKVSSYKWYNSVTGESIEGTSGRAHQEKNWGKGFPPAWIWAEGFDFTSGASFALSLGVLDIFHVDVPAHLIGYRSPSSDLILNFRPTNSFLEKSFDGCTGQINVTVTGWGHKMVFELWTEPSTLQTCLLGPTERGFVPVCVESYSSVGMFYVYEISFNGYRLVEKREFTRCALEFGGDYVCPDKNPCKKTILI